MASTFVPSAAQAYDVQIEIKEQAVDAMLDEVGTISGKTGVITVWLDLLFVKVKVAQDTVKWNLSNIDVDLSAASGVQISGDVSAKYSGWTVNGSIGSANTSITYDEEKRALRLKVTSVTIPYEVDTPLGTFSRSTTVDPKIDITYALGTLGLPHSTPAGLSTVTMGASQLTPSILDGRILLHGKVVAW